MRARRGIAVVLGVVAAAVAGTLAQSADAQPARVVLDAIVVTINGQIITASDVRAAEHLARARGHAPADPVSALVDRALMLDEVQRASLATVAPDLVEAKRREVVSALGQATRVTLAERDALSDGRLLAWVRDDLRIEAYLSQRFTAAAQPTDEEVAAYFAANAARFTEPGTVADDAATARAQTALAATRRQALIDAWLEGLRRRADIVAAPR